MNSPRKPVETQPGLAPLAVLPVFLRLAGKPARRASPAATPARPGRRSSSPPPAPPSRCSRREPSDEMRRAPAEAAAGSITMHEPLPGAPRTSKARPSRSRRSRTRRSAPPSSRRRGRAGVDRQRGRPAASLRRAVRRHRQPLAARRRHLDGRRGAGVRAGDPLARSRRCCRAASRAGSRPRRSWRDASSATARRAFAQRRDFWERFSDRALAEARPRPGAGGSRRPPRRDRERRERRARLGRPRRRRAGRSRASDAQGGAGAAHGRHHPLRRPRRARDPRLRPPRGAHHARRQDRPRPVLPAGRDQRADGRGSPARASAWCG